jgi:hypothetical protein
MPTRASILVGAAMLVALSVSACDTDVFGVRGSGNVITESRDVSGFDEIVVLGSGEVVVDIDGTESLSIEAGDNIMPLLKTEVSNGRLELSADSSISPTTEVKYTITATALAGVSISGSGDVAAAGIAADSFSVEVSGSGRVEPTGTTDTLVLDISGSGNYVGADMVAAAGTVSISGSGKAVVNVTDDLDVDISGSGSVAYIGDPSLTTSISGSGDIQQR